MAQRAHDAIRYNQTMSISAEQASPNPAEASLLAAAWRARLDDGAAGMPVGSMPLPPRDAAQAIAALAEFAAATLKAGHSLMIVVPDDEWLPEVSNALDLDLRPLCLVLPEAAFAAGIALRATLSLLKSRLTRSVAADCRAAWDTQLARLDRQAALWQAALAWSAGGRDSGPWPPDIGELFPVVILPDRQLPSLSAAAPRDRLLLLHPERLRTPLTDLLARGERCLILRDPAAANARALAPFDEERQLRSELEMLTQEVGEMELEFATAQGELAEFTRRYHAQVGSRMVELDALQAQLAQQRAARAPDDAQAQRHAEQAREQAERSHQERTRFTELDREVDKPFAPSGDLKRLFRQLAQKIHPDRAENEEDRVWRTELMSEANRAYRSGDEMVLREILRQWEAGQRGDDGRRPSGKAPAGTLAQQVAKMRQRLADINEQLDRLLASRLYELFAAANLARSRNRDLLQEMAEQLDAQIAAARREVEQCCAV